MKVRLQIFITWNMHISCTQSLLIVQYFKRIAYNPICLELLHQQSMNCWIHRCLPSRFLTIWEQRRQIVGDRKAQETIHKKKLEEITTLREQLALVSTESESGLIMYAHEFINYELEFDLNNPYILHEKVMQMIMNPLKKLTMCKLVMWWSIEQDSRMLK